MEQNQDKKIENNSSKTTTMQGLTMIKDSVMFTSRKNRRNGKNGRKSKMEIISVKWVEETQSAHYKLHGAIFDRVFSIDEITGGKTSLGFKLHANLSFIEIGENIGKGNRTVLSNHQTL